MNADQMQASWATSQANLAQMDANNAYHAAASWQSHAKDLEGKLREWDEHCIKLSGHRDGIAAVRDALLAELLRIEPQHPLLVQSTRQAISDAASAASIKKVYADRAEAAARKKAAEVAARRKRAKRVLMFLALFIALAYAAKWWGEH